MSQADQVADSIRGGATKHRGARPPVGAKRGTDKQTRLQLHLGETTVKRLSVHAALVGRNSSRVAEEILSGWLSRFGKGREIFTDDPGVQVTLPPEE